eukprot:3395063-Rhodomonas_salina.1
MTSTPMLIFIVQGGWGVGARCNAETCAMVSGVRGATVRHDDSTDGNTLIVLRGVTVDRWPPEQASVLFPWLSFQYNSQPHISVIAMTKSVGVQVPLSGACAKSLQDLINTTEPASEDSSGPLAGHDLPMGTSLSPGCLRLGPDQPGMANNLDPSHAHDLQASTT